MGIFSRLFGHGRTGVIRRSRSGVRVPIEERAEMRRNTEPDPQGVILADISVSGARITTPAKLARGEEITVVVNAGRQQPLTFGCRVVTAARRAGRLHFDYGLQFVAVRPGEEERLRRFVARRADARFAGDVLI